MALLTGVALLCAGLAAYFVELRRVDDHVREQITQELREFQTLQERGVDPATNAPFADPDRLLTTFMTRNQPNAHERIIAFSSNGDRRFLGRRDSSLFSSPDFVSAVDRLRAEGGSTVVETTSGRHVVAVRPVLGPEEKHAAFVVAWNVTAQRAEIRSMLLTYVAVALGSWLVITLVAWLIAGRLLRPVRTLQATAARITDGGELSRRIPVTGSDDLTALTETLNEMLERLDQAFASQRELLDDAGHELRTPLTVLRGHLELLDVGDPDEVASTRTLLLDEVDRMSLLVDDLLVLAKARRPDFVQPEPVDAVALVTGILDKCRALGPRAWILDAAPPEGAVVHLDPRRTTQAVLQLAENAVRHTADGDTIAVGCAVDDEGTTLWVRDSGPGVSPADREVLFERFRRGSAPRGEGFGLGLSIVSAIADAHGGTVSLDPHRPGEGATFRLTLPATRTSTVSPEGER
ncbi:HAMP domain-containing histidine kinase [Mumia zhuanghuii]|uniref:histidine kinase n=2 Tax=Mumia TaxID=1546255 RepID=A0ABW1QT03_9ACTN|nr:MULTISPECIES: HAMP domain-containing sensor histidine kinase [Mumia]KAA1420587.1 HAMP domain-containing histidine kinase [Mumia zhuanghuii]